MNEDKKPDLYFIAKDRAMRKDPGLHHAINGTFFMDREIAKDFCSLLNARIMPPVYLVAKVVVSGVEILEDQPGLMDHEFLRELQQRIPASAASLFIPEKQREILSWKEMEQEIVEGGAGDEQADTSSGDRWPDA